ncbi:three-Cys-motif partner protein TcmP, partial [Chloroflexota bacterium]
LAPSFFFIDPFGPAGFSMESLEQISKQDRSEVLINFSYQSLNQWFLSDPSKHKIVDILFGDYTWREVLPMPSKQKEAYLRFKYQEALEKLGWKVRPFCMINKHNQTQYYLFYATKNPLGMLAMKRAMWKAAPVGDFQYSDLSNPSQPNMFEETYQEQYSLDLADGIYQKHKGTSVQKKALILNDLAWHPICIERHLTRALKCLENEVKPPRIIRVDDRQKRGSYPDRSTIVFSN